ncbi:tyrosine-type recombinase/integrase [Phocaeicola sp.]|uniref:tyrosine-type recombinase/integrase n=1 Tax=Phocaeicola sp. TaxID=2773926 RepID=UPI003AB84A52
MARFSVSLAIFEETESHPEYSLHLILDDGIPDVPVNQALLQKSLRKKRNNDPIRESTSALYQWTDYANYLWYEQSIHYMDAPSSSILDYLYFLSTEKGLRNDNIKSYINTISKVYETLAIKNYSLHESLFRPVPEMALHGSIQTQNRHQLTFISKMSSLLPRESKITTPMPSYCKWYTKQQIDALQNQLRLDYSCIFLISIYTGLRISSILSLRLDSFNQTQNTISETRSKTGQIHTCYIPRTLTNMLTTYITEMRSMYMSPSEFLFIQKDGSLISYNAYQKALCVAAKNAGFQEPVHTHAGRSTFLANLRSYQLREKRLGHETFSDSDICLLMDWTSLQCLYNYDSITRIQELSPLLDILQQEIYNNAQISFSSGGG